MQERVMSCIDCGVKNCDKMDKTYPDFCLTTNMDPEVYQDAMDRYKEEDNHKVMVAAAEVEYEHYCQYTRVEEIIAFAKKIEAKKIGIATSNGRILVEDTLKALEAAELFDVVRTACEVAKGKPAPDVYLLAAKDMEVDPGRCLVFEDVPMGILAGKNAGMKVCAVDDEFSRYQEEKKRSLADYYIYSYDDIKNETYEVL